MNRNEFSIADPYSSVNAYQIPVEDDGDEYGVLQRRTSFA